MRVLLDESLPVRFERELHGHTVKTVTEEGWSGKKNGELLRAAVERKFDIFITTDQNLQYQVNLLRTKISIIVLISKTNRFGDLKPLVPKTLIELNTEELILMYYKNLLRSIK